MTTLKTESDQSMRGGFTQCKGSLPYNRSTPNLFIENTHVTDIKTKLKKSRHLNDSISV